MIYLGCHLLYITHLPTILGGIISFFMIITTVLLVVLYGKEFLNKNRPTMLTSKENSGNTTLTLNSSNFFFAFLPFPLSKEVFVQFFTVIHSDFIN